MKKGPDIIFRKVLKDIDIIHTYHSDLSPWPGLFILGLVGRQEQKSS